MCKSLANLVNLSFGLEGHSLTESAAFWLADATTLLSLLNTTSEIGDQPEEVPGTI
jgi:hypothetical protein